MYDVCGKRNSLHQIGGTAMITYVNDKSEKYHDAIIHALRSHNRRFTGPVEPESLHIYAFDNNRLVGALDVSYFWDWATIGAVFYENKDVLRTMVGKAWQHYGEKAVGVKLFTPSRARFDAFLGAGFKETAVLRVGPHVSYYADLDSFDKDSKNHYDTTAQKEPVSAHKKVLDAHEKSFKAHHDIKESSEAIQIVALDEEKFVGGVQADVYDDSVYVSRIAVVSAYRQRSVGSTLMRLLMEEAGKRNIAMLDLGTTGFQARAFYEKLGFEIVYTRRDNPRGYESHTMVKYL